MDKEDNSTLDADKTTIVSSVQMETQTEDRRENTTEGSDQELCDDSDASSESTKEDDGSDQSPIKESIKESIKQMYMGKEDCVSDVSRLEHEIKKLRLQNQKLIEEKEALQKIRMEKEKKILELRNEQDNDKALHEEVDFQDDA